MDEILAFLVEYCANLYNKHGFRFVDSEVAPSFGNAAILLRNRNLEVQFIRDKGQLFLDFKSICEGQKVRWYSLDLVRQMVTGETFYHSMLDDANGRFLRENLPTILGLFECNCISETVHALDALRVKRGAELFGTFNDRA